MRYMSDRARERAEEAEPARVALRQLGVCEVCARRNLLPGDLAVHEIANGPLRQKALDLTYAVLVVCRHPDFRSQTDCHRTVQNEQEARQLARICVFRPWDYNLPAYLHLTRPAAPRRISEAEVSHEMARLLADQKFRQAAVRCLASSAVRPSLR